MIGSTGSPDGGEAMGMTTARIAILLLALVMAGTWSASAREPGLADGVTSEQLSVEAFSGEPGKEVVTHRYTFPAGSVLPWHIHANAHEVAYVLEGDFTFEIQGQGKRHLKAGEAFYLAPNLVHRGMNEGTVPVKLFVVRVKPVAQPLVTEVPAPQ